MFQLSPLPFDKKALEPYISSETLDYHHGKHHQAYVNNLNALIETTSYNGKTLEEIIRQSEHTDDKIFNNAAQIWNHDFFWKSLCKNGAKGPSDKLKEKIERDFGSLENFKNDFKQAAISQFGSGWAWLVQDKETLKIVKTPNAQTPLTSSFTPLLTCDVWEHAYYIDYQNRRPDFVQTFLDHLVNWDFIENNLSS